VRTTIDPAELVDLKIPALVSVKASLNTSWNKMAAAVATGDHSKKLAEAREHLLKAENNSKATLTRYGNLKDLQYFGSSRNYFCLL